jgi:hypothetical protein
MYEFVMAGNGVFLQARSRALQVTLPLVWANIPGLAHLARDSIKCCGSG